ncbi:MAG: hypothetical protein DRR42_08210 [Gammaproteobacteria bacterium]|nr:MAG: hypothetical protein DRR42_08210 [Gammaproteobacteria bacterium]
MSPNFHNPPVVERVIGIQFEELPFFTNAHAGWFWKSFLKDSAWSHLSTAPPIINKFEQFGEKKFSASPAPFQISTAPPPERSQIVRESDDMMIQFQNSRFLLNWRRKNDQQYPDFEDLLDEFGNHFKVFQKFVGEAGGSTPKINQWEVTYVNHIPKDGIWSNASDWLTLFPGFSLPSYGEDSMTLETIGANWSLNLPNQAGRLHISLKHAIATTPKKGEIIVLELTARGPATDFESFKQGLDLGHDAIVNTFANITSIDAHKVWGRNEK